MKLKFSFSAGMVCSWMIHSTLLGAAFINDFTPTVGAPGDMIQLNGSGFTSGGIILQFWNGVAAVNGSINSDTIINVQVPAGATTGPISIQQGGVTSVTTNDFLVIGPGPYVTDVSPAYAAVNDSVTVSGVHFSGATAVLFSGVNAPATPNAAGTLITTRVPQGATNGFITVVTPNGASNSPAPFTVVGPGPFISDFTPTAGLPGTKVQIDGLHLTGVTNVTFNGKPGFIVSATSDTLIQVQAPPGLLTGPIAVSTPLGTFVTSSNFYGNPGILSLTPTSGRAGTNVSIIGTNLLGARLISNRSVASASFSVINNSNISATVPVGAKTGLVRVIVPGGSSFSPTNFVVPPTLSGFTPVFGPVGASITITGANLNAGSVSVKFNGVTAPTPTGVTFNQLTVQVPSGATTGPITLTTVDGSDLSSNLFYLPATITGLSATNSPEGSLVVITGQNFIGTSMVTFGGVSAVSFNVSSNTSIAVTVPVGAITGPVSVTTPAGTAASQFLFYGAPMISDFTPTRAMPGDSVTIHGINFLGGKVQFGSLAAAVLSLNNTQIVATVPAGAQTGPISVITPGGTNTSAAQFIVQYKSDLQVGLTNSQATVTVGSNLLYTITVFNAGPNPAPNVVVSNNLGANVLLRSVTVPASWVFATNGNAVIASTSSFGTGNSVALTILVTPQASGTLTNVVSILSDNIDPFPVNDTAAVTTLVEPLALLSIRELGNLIKVSWPVALSNSVLQFEDSVLPGWSVVTNPPAIIGGTATVTQTNNGASRFIG